MESKNPASYSPAADFLRVLAILGVLMIHTSGRMLESVSYDLARVPWTLFLNQATRFAVPMFFMISGFVLELSHRDDVNSDGVNEAIADYFKFLWKRLNRIAIPYVFWSIIYYLFVYSQNHEPFPQVLIDGSASYQLYFIPTLIIFYAVFPLVHNLYRIFSNRWLLASLGLVQIWILYQSYYVGQLNIYFTLAIALLNFYPFLIGMVVSRNQEKILKFIGHWKLVFGFLVFGFLYVVYTEGLNIYLRTHNYLVFTSQWRPSVQLYMFSLSAILYSLLNYKIFQQVPVIQTVKVLSKLSFFVFFVHIIFLELAWSRIFLPMVSSTQTHIVEQLWFDPAFFLTVTLASFGTAYLVHKLPLVNKITG